MSLNYLNKKKIILYIFDTRGGGRGGSTTRFLGKYRFISIKLFRDKYKVGFVELGLGELLILIAGLR